MKRALTIVSLGGFASTLFARAVDPIIPQIAADLVVDPQSAALLATAFAFPFALVPPIFGSFADIFGKVRLIIVCQCVLVLAGIVSAIAPNIETLVAGRMLAGAAAGGIFPVSLALVGDIVPVKERQIGLSRYLAAMITGSLLGSTMAGLIGDALGWRAVFVVMTACAIGSLLSVAIGLRNISLPKSAPLDLRGVPASYRAILANPRAKICYVAVMIEGAVVFGLLPYVALLLAAGGETRALIAGIVLASFAIGGLVYSSIITRLLGWFGPFRLMFLGALSCALSLSVAAFDPSWPIKALAFAGFGFGFYSLHGYLQVQATELSATARGAALALHSTAFFLGQALGPILYGIGFNNIGATASILIAAGIILMVGLIVPRLLKSRGLSAAPD